MEGNGQLHTATALTLGKKAFVTIRYEAIWASKICTVKAIFNAGKLDDILLLVISAFVVRFELNSVQGICT
jgi:hypothetical protein